MDVIARYQRLFMQNFNLENIVYRFTFPYAVIVSPIFNKCSISFSDDLSISVEQAQPSLYSMYFHLA